MPHRTSDIRGIVEGVIAAAALVAVSPILLAASVCIVCESGGPILFRQRRIGLHGRPFTLIKLRSMSQTQSGAAITASGDVRITRVGMVLRRYKLDELPQLWNICIGDMQFFGPRPEVPSHVDLENSQWSDVLSQKPGLTDPASLVYRNEEEILAGFEDPDRAYRDHVLPDKLGISSRYQQRRSFASDMKLLVLTARFSFFPTAFEPDTIRRIFGG